MLFSKMRKKATVIQQTNNILKYNILFQILSVDISHINTINFPQTKKLSKAKTFFSKTWLNHYSIPAKKIRHE